MPLFGKSNKSQSPAGNSSNQSSSTISSVHDPPQQRYQQLEDQSRRPHPARSQSHRHSSNISLDRPPVNVAASVNEAEASPPSERSAHHDHRFSYHRNSENTQQPRGEEPKKSIRSRIFGSSSKEPPPPQDPNPAGGRVVNRRVSLRKQDGTPPVRYQTPTDDQQRLQPQNWNPRPHGSSSNLPISAEEDENNLDPFLQASDDGSPQVPQVPLKDSPYGPQQGFAQHSHSDQQYQDQYRPELARVDTNQGHYLNRGNLEHYSPEQHSGSSGNSAPQSQPYVAYQSEAPSPAQGHPQQGYQPFQPQGQQQQRQQQQQQQQQQHLGQPPSYTAASQTQPQHQETQAFQSSANQAPPGFQEAQGIRRPGQQALPADPSSTRPLQQAPPKDPQLLQAGRPSSSQQFSPPSPLPASQPYQAYEPAPGSQGSNTPNESDGPQEQNSMAPPTTHNRNNLRSGDLSKQNLAGPLTRESSLQAPPAAVQGPPTPGVSGFSAGVVPQAAQGQPHRGNGKPDGENGRDTPPLARSVGDMSEEEVADIIKEHAVLREKYQKVKRYFFDQQSQVHQLQNTLANQRMSLSRTSLDDSEYAARFNRLDGLVGQLAHSIRKSWKSIPPWMLPYVNKEAITAGAKEMIIVGRSAITGWLHEEVFEKYFHPDLELGLSTQLKSVQQNIRKFSPPTHSVEEEEAVWSKIINWRMATLEGLADILRSSQAATNRQRLVEALNEKMIASLEMYLNESASPELHGNVPMIIELAIGIASHVPMESRDVNIEYYRPGRLIDPELMKLETGIAALTNPCIDPEGGENASLASAASEAKDDQDASNAPLREEQKRSRGMFGGLMSTKKTPQPGKPVTTGVGGGSQVSLTQPPGSSSGPKEDVPPRVRLAAGLAVQIRGRSILVKAPVYST